MKKLTVLGMFLVCSAPLAAQNVAEAVNSITPEDIRERIGVIAHDSMQGRETPSPGLDMTAAWIGEQFRSFGLTPGGDDGTYLQRYPLIRTQLDIDASHVMIGGGPTWHFGQDLVLLQGLTSDAGVGGDVVVLTGPLDQPDASIGSAVAGKVVIVAPSGAMSRRAMSDVTQALGDAAAVIVVAGDASANWLRQLERQNRFRVTPEWRGGGRTESTPVIQVTDGTMAPVLAQTGSSLDAARDTSGKLRAHPLDGLRFHIKVVNGVDEVIPTPNTVGVLEGSDPELKDEYIVFSAHMDHVGTSESGGCREVEGDGICNGADDDASGTIGIVELAEAFAMMNPRPRRSLIFVTVSGEEKGLWGSDYFARNPGMPTENIVANLNADMIGRNWSDTIVVIGKEHSDLGTTLNEVNSQHPELNMTAIDDLWPDQNFYFRSDHVNFARRGIPILFFFNGTHDNYHRPSDHVELIDVEKESRIVKLMLYLGLEIANNDARPEWNPESYAEIVRPVP